MVEPSTVIPSSAAGIFGIYQREYAERGLPTFPVRIDGAEKKPAIRGWQRVGLRGSTQLANKFASTSALGVALNSRRMVVDVDTKSESVLGDVLARYGDTPLIAQTASKGGYHCYYGNNTGAWRHYRSSRRAIRPEPNWAVDYLGTGFAVVPPSVTASGRYEFIRGNLDDISHLPPFSGLIPRLQSEAKKPATKVTEGFRNNELFDGCREQAPNYRSPDELVPFARNINASFGPPLDDTEVVKTALSAWNYRDCRCDYLVFRTEDVIALLNDSQDAFILLAFLRANGCRAPFMIADGLTETLHWTVKRVSAARKRLLELGYIEKIRRASQNSPALFRWREREERERGRSVIGGQI
jgi:hypothetical protein